MSEENFFFLFCGYTTFFIPSQLLKHEFLILAVLCFQRSDGKYTIRGVHLPNSEELGGSDDIQVSVALGFVSHVVQMLSIFLQVPLRYPLINFGSRSKIVDLISEKLSDRERE